MSLTQRMHFLQDMFQMTTIVLVLEINHYHINEQHLFGDTLDIISFIIPLFKCVYLKSPSKGDIL